MRAMALGIEKIKTVEAPQNYPRYFESMVIRGGYTQNLFVVAPNSTEFLTNRIFKGTADKRNILHAGKISLTLDRTVTVNDGAMISFPRSIIHQVTHTQPDSLSINCILKNEENSTYYDVYLPKYSEQDPQIHRDALIADETGLILLRMKEILIEWKKHTHSCSGIDIS